MVCCKADGMTCSLDPDTCNVGILGFGDTLAKNCGECPKPCCLAMGGGICSMLSSKACIKTAGKVADNCTQCNED
eukprot:Pgem_evm1s18388